MSQQKSYISKNSKNSKSDFAGGNQKRKQKLNIVFDSKKQSCDAFENRDRYQETKPCEIFRSLNSNGQKL